MRVAHLIHSLEPGGAEAVLVDLAEAAPAAGFVVAVMPLVRTRDRRHVRSLQQRGIDVLDLDLPSRWDPRAFPRAVSRLRAWQPDVVHTHLKHADLVGALASRRLRRPMVSTLHIVDDAPGVLPRAKRRLAGLGRVSTAARTVTVSDAQRRWYIDAFPAADEQRVVTVRNGVADPPAAPAHEVRRSLGIPHDDLIVVQVGLLRDGKGHHDLLAAAALLEDLARLHVLVVGDGPLRVELESTAGSNVRFLGYREDVPSLLQAADVVVQPSRADALPTVLIQALAAGRPAVASAVGGIPEIVTPDCGVLVPPGAPDALAGAVRGLLLDPQRRELLGAAARARFVDVFEAARWAERLHALYRELDVRPRQEVG